MKQEWQDVCLKMGDGYMEVCLSFCTFVLEIFLNKKIKLRKQLVVYGTLIL